MARLGGDEGQEVIHQFDNADGAQTMVKRMMAMSAGDWRSLLGPLRRESQRREAGD